MRSLKQPSAATLKKMCRFSQDLARLGGRLLLKRRQQPGKVTRKGLMDFASETDTLIEKKIRQAVKRQYPEHQFLGEEQTKNPEADWQDGWCWVVDPLDGTTNYLHGLPHYATSVGLCYQGKALVGAIYDPCRDEMFYAWQGGGAFLNRRSIKVSTHRQLSEAFLATGFSYHTKRKLDRSFRWFRKVSSTGQTVRRCGSAALDLAYTAAGRFDGFWEEGLSPWDVCAGMVLIQEAGGVVSSLHSKHYCLWSDPVVIASNQALHPSLKRKLRSHA